MNKKEIYQFLLSEFSNRFNDWTLHNISNYFWARLSQTQDIENIPFDQFKTTDSFKLWIQQLNQGHPIQYVLQNACFYGLDLEVNDKVLIPRPETEELVQWILEDYNPKTRLNLLDIGTGSGCIAIAIKKHRPHWNIMGVDISNEAISLARKNATHFKMDIPFLQIDFLTESSTLKKQFDIIVSNPPYVSKAELLNLKGMVLKEPQLALVPEGNDPLVFYKETANWVRTHQVNFKAMYFEINEYLAEETKMIFSKEKYSSVSLKKDMQGKKRMLRVIN